ncbi:hypothetical protein [Enterobacter cloacae complex sp. CARB60]|uniref:hypothetical protein n=1 Tax=Enterobacter cloacae complex sp. CARB60 TaxID=3119569 RepID=UPI002F4162B8
MVKKHAYVEYRPKSTSEDEEVIHHVVIVDGEEIHTEKTQEKAADWALEKGYAVHVARERHLKDLDQPPLFRVYP